MKGLVFLVCVGSLFIAAACAPKVPLVLTPEAQRIPVGEADPGQGYQVIEGIDVQDGHGCGMYGTLGTFNGALIQLRYEAGLLHADFVKIIAMRTPYGDGNCFHNAYSISAIAYKKTAATEAP